MAAIIQTYQPREVDRVVSPTPVQAGQTALGNLAEGMGQIADAAWTFEDELATAHAYQVDTEFSNLLRETMDNPETGYRQTRGMAAVERGQQVLQDVQTRYREMVGHLNPRVREATLRSLESRWQTFVSAVQSHSTAQARAGVAGASRARISAATEDAAIAILNGDADAYANAELTVRATVEESAAYLAAEPAAQERMLREALSPLHTSVIDVVGAEQGARAALGYYWEHADEIATSDRLDIQPRLVAAASDEEGAEQGNAAFDEVIADPPQWEGSNLEPIAAEGGATELQNPAMRDYVGVMPEEDPEVAALRGPQMSVPTPQGFLDPQRPDLLPPQRGEYIPPAEFVPPPTIEEARAALDQIENPRVRAAAIESFDLRVTQWQAEQEQVHDQALAAAYEAVEQGAHPITGIPPNVRAMLTPQEQSQLISYSRNLASAMDPDTPDDVFYELSLLRETGDVQGLARALLNNRDRISGSDYRSFSNSLAAMQGGEDGDINFGTLRTVIDRELRLFNISTTSTATPDERALQMRVQNEIERWMRGSESLPDEGAIRQRTQELLVELTLDTNRVGDERTLRGVDIDFTGATSTATDDVTLDQMQAAADDNGLTVHGVRVSSDDLQATTGRLTAVLGRDPTAQEVFGALVRITTR